MPLLSPPTLLDIALQYDGESSRSKGSTANEANGKGQQPIIRPAIHSTCSHPQPGLGFNQPVEELGPPTILLLTRRHARMARNESATHHCRRPPKRRSSSPNRESIAHLPNRSSAPLPPTSDHPTNCINFCFSFSSRMNTNECGTSQQLTNHTTPARQRRCKI